jgi:deoxyribodipyrimidine photolyase
VKGKAAQTFITLQKHLENSHEIKIFVNEDVYIDFYKQVETVRKHGISIEVLRDQLTVDKETKSGSGGYYSVFSPFKRAVWREFLNSTVLDSADFSNVRFADSSILEAVADIETVVNSFDAIWSLFSKNRKFEAGGKTYDIDTLLDYHPDFSNAHNFYYTEAEANKRFQVYLTEHLSDYKDKRDSLSIDGTSKMSLALAWGLTSSRILKSEIQKYFATDFTEFGDSKIISEKKLLSFAHLNW